MRVLIANERRDRLVIVAAIVVALGHQVIAREIDGIASCERPHGARAAL